jgi:hypothetical protein
MFVKTGTLIGSFPKVLVLRGVFVMRAQIYMEPSMSKKELLNRSTQPNLPQLKHKFRWLTAGVICGLGGGIIAPVLGSILTVITWITVPTWHGVPLQRFGTVLLVLGIPLLIAGAHCLDLIDKREEEMKSCETRSDHRV